MLNVTVNLFPDSRLVALQNCVPRYELREVSTITRIRRILTKTL